MIEELLKEFKINYLTEEQYKTAKENGELNENELYLTPDDEDSINAVLQALQSEIAKLNTENATLKTDNTLLKEQVKVGLNRDFMKITASKDMTMVASEYTKVPYDELWEYINDYGTFQFRGNGEIEILRDDVKKVHISAGILDKSWGAETLYLEIRKNGAGIRNCYVKNQSSVRNEAHITVKKGDVLSVCFYCAEQKIISPNRVYTQMIVSV